MISSATTNTETGSSAMSRLSVQNRNSSITLLFIKLFGTCLFFSSSLHAYEPDIHRQLSHFSVSKVFKLLSVPEPYDGFAELAASEDAGEDTSLRSSLQRPTNWHFYNPHKEHLQQSRWLGFITINRSMTRLVEQRQKDLLHTLNQPNVTFSDFATRFGRSIHFIEDVTVPAHVTPVFHGPALPGNVSGHNWPTIIHDAFDGYPVDMNELERQWEGLLAQPQRLKQLSNIHELPHLTQSLFLTGTTDPVKTDIDVNQSPVMHCVDLVARTTLARIPSPENTSKTYWNEDIGNDYFQGYGASFDELNNKERREFVNKQHFLATVAVVSLGIHLWNSVRQK